MKRASRSWIEPVIVVMETGMEKHTRQSLSFFSCLFTRVSHPPPTSSAMCVCLCLYFFFVFSLARPRGVSATLPATSFTCALSRQGPTGARRGCPWLRGRPSLPVRANVRADESTNLDSTFRLLRNSIGIRREINE